MSPPLAPPTRQPPTPTSALLGMMLAGDLAFVFAFGLLGLGLISDSGFTLTYDRSYGEIYQYIKQFWVVLLLLGLAWSRRAALYGVFAAMFGFFLVDDYAELHENWGERLAETLQLPHALMLQPYDFGELIVFGVYAVVAGGAAWLAYRVASHGDRRVVWEIVGLLGLIALFGVGVDLLHALDLHPVLSDIFGALEDGGEMIAFSLLVWRLLTHATRPAEEASKAAQPLLHGSRSATWVRRSA